MDPCPQATPQFPCYPSQPWWFPPPADDSSPSGGIPTWVIVGLVAAALMFLALVLVFFKKRDSKLLEEAKEPPHPVASGRLEKVVGEPKKAVTQPPPPPRPLKEEFLPYRDPHMVAMNVNTNPIKDPGNCGSCGRKAGLYQISYKCAKCAYKYDIGIHVQYPNKH